MNCGSRKIRKTWDTSLVNGFVLGYCEVFRLFGDIFIKCQGLEDTIVPLESFGMLNIDY